MTDSQKIAHLIFPSAKTIDYFRNKYPLRALSADAFVTRFAPSPTGYLHLGGFMQTIIDTTLARQTGGVSILRIEDTDTKREVKEAVDVILKLTAAFNFVFNEGAGFGGAYGPYYQSQRKEIFQTFAKELIAKGHAYPCFCTREEEEQMRKKQAEQKELTGYFGAYRKCDKLSPAEIEKKIKAGLPFVVRLRAQAKSLEEKIEVQDEIRGTLNLQRWFKDDVIIKSDGQSLYHLAHIADDYLMGVNLVVRGSEWLSTYALHWEIGNLLGIQLPRYLHTGLVCKYEGTSKVKLSKRKHPEATMSYFVEQGYPKEGVIEYILTLLNPNFESWRAQNTAAPLSDFMLDIQKMSAGEALFDNNKLSDICKNVIARIPATDLYHLTLAWAKEFKQDFYHELASHKEKWIAALSIDRDGAKPRKDLAKFSETEAYYSYFITAPKVNHTHPDATRVLTAYSKVYSEGDEKIVWFDKIKAMADTLGYATDTKAYKTNPTAYQGTVADICAILRLAVTGRENSPDLYAILKVLGQKEVLNRISK